MGLLDGKVALISGAARGQGRSHAVRFAEEGADIIALDVCEDIAANPYPLARWEDLQETEAMVEKLDRRIMISKTDVRDADAVRAAVAAGVAEFGHLDAIVANAGITAYVPSWETTDETWRTILDVDLTGAWNIASTGMKYLMEQGTGGSITFTSSSAALIGLQNLAAYSAAKAGLVGLMQCLSVELGPHMIRVNTVHPTGVNTTMLHNQATFDVFIPGANLAPGAVDADSMETIKTAMAGLNSMPIPWVEPVDISNAMVYLASDLGRYVSGTQLRVDAGSAAR